MSVDYNNYKEWKDVELVTEQVSLDQFTEYGIEELNSLFTKLLEKASNAGLENCYLKFESRQEPYEDWLGAPVVFPCGYRRLNYKELEELKYQEYLEELAKEKGITVYEAKHLHSLSLKGLVKL